MNDSIAQLQKRIRILEAKLNSTQQFMETMSSHQNAQNSLLLVQNERLEEIVRERTAELDRKVREADEANKAKSEFLANMSHEIRTPLTAVLGLAKMGMRENRGEEPEETFDQIVKSGQHLLNVINDILDFSKIEAGMLIIESRPLQIIPAVEEAIGMVSEQAEDKGLALSVNFEQALPAWIAGDEMRLRQILLNLLSNAVKFTPRGSVSLSVTCSDGMLQFSVSDTGIGMSEEAVDRLFTPFEQADSSTTRKYGGTGLGLAICCNLARLMKGKITAESKVGTGSVFSLNLPLLPVAPQPDPHSAFSEPKGPMLKGLTILAAEDVEMNRVILEDLLDQEGAKAIFAENGQQALDRLEKQGASSFDAVLMDLQMPVMDGFEATRRILERAPGLPIIGLTAHALAEERKKCLAAGMVDHVTKPIDPDILIAAIRKHVG
jgi:signal transduction histidine kinase